ncbi:MAG: radical SAM protein [Hadesarchaea archaeon]|nr:MAG: radical SAM protein [Hadesarchaea archaeon]
MRCGVCGREAPVLSSALGVCPTCVRERFEEARPLIEAAHTRIREERGLPPLVPSGPGPSCEGCGNACRIPEGGLGYCGLVRNEGGRLVRRLGTAERGLVSWYLDPLPTNCVPAEFCAGSGGAGYPRWCRTPRGDLGYFNLAVFLGSCTFHCLFCQNFTFHSMLSRGGPVAGPEELAGEADEGVGCTCYFGGDPSSQMPFVLSSARALRRRAEEEGRLLRICLETNLNQHPRDLEEVARICLESGGGIKADLKCWSEEGLYALSGVRTRVPYRNFERLSRLHRERPEVPFLRASTLLVPGYVDEEEVRALASFIADLDPTIPYVLLAFHPTYWMSDLPHTRRREAERYLEICREEGLTKVRIGNPWLLR